jgi:hypothetical protein
VAGAVTGTQDAAAAALVEAVAGGARDDRVRGALARAVAAGALVPGDRPGLLVPAGPALVASAAGAAGPEAPACWGPWLARGYRPFRCKPATHRPAERRALRVLFAALPEDAGLRCVPVWAVPGAVLSLHLPDAADLRARPGADPREAAAVHTACLDWLAYAVTADRRLRNRLAAAGLPAPRPFPVAARYRRAVRMLTGLVGDPGLPAELPLPRRTGPAALFWDPKPANFVLPATDRPAVTGPAKVDVDSLHEECPLSLQLLLVLFAHPVVAPLPGAAGPDEVLGALLETAYAAADRFAVPAAEIDAMLCYHLARNLTSAVAAEPAKARALAPLLAATLRRMPFAHPSRLALDRLAVGDVS